MYSYYVPLWCCLVLASTSALGQVDRFIDESQVYDYWIQWLDEHEPNHPAYSSASAIFQDHPEGFRLTYAWDGRRENLVGQITSTNNFVWFAGFPVAVVDYRGDVSFPNAFAPMSSFDTPTNISPLVKSAWDFASSHLNQQPVYMPHEPGFVPYNSLPLNSFQPHGQLKISAVRIALSNAPIGYLTAEVRQGPYWHCSLLDLYVYPNVYYEITGDWPSDNQDTGVILMKDAEWDTLIRNARVRILERWK